MLRIIAIWFIAGMLAGSAPAQEQDQIAVGADLVNVNVTVTGPGGKYVTGLTPDQFELRDDNVRQKIAFFSANDSPMSLGIVYDLHPTTLERTTATLRALRQFVRTLRPEDSYFVLTFNEYGSLMLDFVPTQEQVQVNLTPGGAHGPTSLYDAVDLAAVKIRETGRAKRALLIISDGQDHHSRNNYRQLRNRLSGFDVQLYGIDLPTPQSSNGDAWTFADLSRDLGQQRLLENAEAAFGRAVLDELARITGGTAYFPKARSDRELVGICTQIVWEMRQQYALSFYPAADADRTKQHKLRITVRRPALPGERLTASYRRTYQLSGKP